MMIWSSDEAGDLTVTVPHLMALLEDLAHRFQQGRGFAVATLNLDHVVKLSGDATFRTAYEAHTHVTADGNPIVWLSRLAGQRVSLLPGSELIEPLSSLAAQHAIPVALFGATQRALEASASVLKERHPKLQIVLCRAPEMGFDPQGAEADACIAELSDSGARLCFLALGAPKQEIFAFHARARLDQVGFVSIGAGLDFIAGTQARAPVWVQKIAAEWLWRLLSDPKRLAKRYGACLWALPGLTGKALRARKRIEI